MPRICWFLLLLVGCGATPAAGQAAPPSETPPPAEVAVVEAVTQPATAVAGRPAVAADVGAPADLKVLDGLEAAGGWFAENWDTTNPATAATVEHERLGKCLHIATTGGKGDKAAVGVALAGSYAAADGLRIDFYNPQPEPLKAAVGLFLGQSRRYYESPMVTLPAGYSTHTVPLDKPLWKTQQTNWRYETQPQGLEQVMQVDVLIYAAGKAECLVAYIAKPAPAAATPPAAAPQRPEEILTAAEVQRLKARFSPLERAAIRELLHQLEKQE